MPEETIRLAIIGVGEHCRRNILPALASCRNVWLAGLFERDEQVNHSAAARWDTKAYSSVDELLADEIDAVYVAVPTGLHFEVGERVLESGHHLWCEKSLCANWRDWQTLVELGREKKLAVFECFMFQFHEQFIRLRRHLTDGTIGAVRSITARFGFPHLKPDDFRYIKRLGGGALLDAGAYPACAARMLFDGIDRVSGFIEHARDFEVDIAGSALIRSTSGVHAHLEWGFGRAYRNEIEIWGENGILFAPRAFSKPPDLATTLVFRMQNGETREESIEPCNHFTRMFDAFAGAVLKGDFTGRAAEVLEQGRLLHRIWERGGLPRRPVRQGAVLEGEIRGSQTPRDGENEQRPSKRGGE